MARLQNAVRSARRQLDLDWNLRVRRRTPTIVYSMERTGTVAMHESLRACGAFTLATHYLSRDSEAKGRLSGSARWAARHVVRPGRPARFVTLVRNPVENILSVFARRALATARSPADQADADPAQRFASEYLDSGAFTGQLTWFESEFSAALGIDVYAQPFNKEQGCVVLRRGPFEALIIRTELGDERKSDAIAGFIGRPGFSMVSAETVGARSGTAPGTPGDRSAYADKYRSLKAGVIIPDHHWNTIINSKFTRHFFTAEEIEASRDRIDRASQAGPRSGAQ